jgi:hypothetical protein
MENAGQKRSKITVTAWNVGADLKRHTYNVPVVERSDSSFNPQAQYQSSTHGVRHLLKMRHLF